MFARNKPSPKKPGSGKLKDNTNPSPSSSKHKDSKFGECSQFIADREIILPVLKTVDPEKYLQTYSASE